MKKFKPPKEVAHEAAIGLMLRAEYGRGGTSVGIGRARQLKSRKPVSLVTIRKMYRFFLRHYKNRKTPPEKGNGRIAWLLWGGDSGFDWAFEILEQEGEIT